MSLTVGCRVRLRSCLYGQPGIVAGCKYGRVLVDWTDLGFTGKHREDDLVLADVKGEVLVQGVAADAKLCGERGAVAPGSGAETDLRDLAPRQRSFPALVDSLLLGFETLKGGKPISFPPFDYSADCVA
jgi:hypothetical protein